MIVLYIFLGLLGLVVLLLLAAIIRTLCLKQKVSAYKAPEAGERAEAYAEKLAEMVRSETVSHSGVHRSNAFFSVAWQAGSTHGMRERMSVFSKRRSKNCGEVRKPSSSTP